MELLFLIAKKVEDLLEDETQMFAMFASLQLDNKVTTIDFHVVCDFLDVFLEDINDLSLECEVEFVVDLVPRRV